MEEISNGELIFVASCVLVIVNEEGRGGNRGYIFGY